MTIGPTTLVFFDASCLIAAAGRPDGGSGFVLSLCARRLLVAVVSQPVLWEAENNILSKLGADGLATYHQLLKQTPMIVAHVPLPEERERFRELVGEKDEHVVVAAATIAAPFLLTLDKRLAQRITAGLSTPRALTPGEFITTILPGHVAFSRLRDT